ncbi:MAG: hypothetical protein IJ088_00915 [Clostridia bacterium]|nr:hypothetical protein [Clostridia bacterium]
MKRLVLLLAFALVFVFAVSVMAEGGEPTPTPVPESRRADDNTDADDGSDDSSYKNVTGVVNDSDAVLDEDVSKYANNPTAINADYALNGEFTEPVIYESIRKVATASDTVTITMASLDENDEFAVFVVYKLNGKIVRKRLNAKWVNGKLVCDIPSNVAGEIAGKQVRFDVIGEKK